MAQMEQDLGTRLDWVAVDHYNTGHPHSHILVRGRDDRGQDLVIAREYITTGLRERAADLVTLDLGPRSDLEIENRLRHDIEQERLTSIDRRLLREVDADRLVWSTDRDAFQQSLRAGRLQKLKRLGLADEVTPGQWRLAGDLETTLRRMGERGDILKTMSREMTAKGLARSGADMVLHDPRRRRRRDRSSAGWWRGDWPMRSRIAIPDRRCGRWPHPLRRDRQGRCHRSHSRRRDPTARSPTGRASSRRSHHCRDRGGAWWAVRHRYPSAS